MAESHRMKHKIHQTLAEHLIPEQGNFGDVWLAKDTQNIWFCARNGLVFCLSDVLDGNVAHTPPRNGRDGKDGVSIKGERGERGEPGRSSIIPGPMGPPGRDGSNCICRNGKDGRDGRNGTRFAFRKNWSAAERYFVNDVVHHDGSAWIAVHDIDKRSVPPSAENHDWCIFAAGGQNGRDGVKGATGDFTVVGPEELRDAVQELRKQLAKWQAAIQFAYEQNNGRPHSGLKAAIAATLRSIEANAR